NTLSVYENLYLKKFPKRYFSMFINWKKMLKDAEKWAKCFDINIELKKNVKDLTNSEKKMVQIMKTYITEPDLAVLHNPSDELNSVMANKLYNIVTHYKNMGKSTLYLTNKWEEALKIADRIIISFEGRIVGEMTSEEAKKNPKKLIALIENNKTEVKSPDNETKAVLKSIMKAAEYISSNYELNDVLLLLAQQAADFMKADVSIINLIDEDTNGVIDSVIWKTNNSIIANIKKEIIMEIAKKETFFYANKHEKEFLDLFDENNSARTVILLPISIKSNVTGIIQLIYENYYIYSEEEQLFLNAFSRQAAIAIEETKLIGRSTLLQESHHRIKNSLQSVINLITMQKRELMKNPSLDIICSLDDVISRVKSIASMHDLLSKEKLGRGIINLNDIVKIILENSLILDKDIKIELDIENIMIPYNKSTSIALIINELISNCYKHAFKFEKSGNIHIECKKTNKEILLNVKDNGIGIGDKEDKKPSTLGVSIINSIVAHEFKGKILYKNLNPGTNVEVIFPIEKIFKE
ncbi:MAG: GAF domain-containing protein, partial [Fusobacteriaceae bacterium]|nr:GAF domain-containing protein [Fusobacteriaceae bacterium]